jgi:alkylation response protein AidB-like acyl-CoA dehydrogenase
MDLALTEFQELLRSTARAFAQRDFPIARVRRNADEGTIFDAETWRSMGELGWLGLMAPVAHGGSGGTWVDLMILLEELGRGLLPQAFLSHTLGAALVAEYGSAEQQAALLPRVSSGALTLAVAVAEPRGTFDEAGVEAMAVRTAGGFSLTGTKHFVRGVEAAGAIIVVAKVDGGAGLFLVDRGAPGVEITRLKPISGEDQAKVTLSSVEVPAGALLGGVQPWSMLDQVVLRAALIECGYGVGVMARDTDMTVQYVKDRVQFGRPIGSFQSVQHDVADQVTDVDASRFLTIFAAWELDAGQPGAMASIARAKAWVSDALRRVSRTGNQLHGGIGFATEYDLHFYYRQAKTNEMMYGAGDQHRERVAAALLD